MLYTVEVKNADGETVIQGFHLSEDMANKMAWKYGGTVTAEKPEQWPGLSDILKT